MTANKWQFMKHVAKLYDLAAIVGAFIVATFIFSSSPRSMTLASFLALRIKLGNCLLFMVLIASWHYIFRRCNLYTSKRLTHVAAEIFDVLKASIFAALLLLAAVKIFHVQMVTGPFILVLWIVSTWAMVSERLITRWFLLDLRRNGRNQRFLLIVGTNERAVEFAEYLSEHPELGYSIVGFVDDYWERMPAFATTGYTRCCNLNDLPEFLRHNVVDEAAVFLPLRSFYERVARLVSLFEQHGIATRVGGDIFKLRRGISRVLDFDEQNPQMLVVAGPREIVSAIAKRSLDFLISSVSLLLLSPVFLVIGLLVKLTSRGPVFFSQTRVGLNKRPFQIYKFRTMVADAEKLQDELMSKNEMSGPVFKISQDPRVTPLGRLLRKTSLDELPQFFNVLNGEMSLVGPRAMSLRDYKLFEQDWPRRRFSVKPGITCLWQIRGRNSIPFDQWMKLDLMYIDKWSIWLDLKILAKTVPAVIRGTGAA